MSVRRKTTIALNSGVRIVELSKKKLLAFLLCDDLQRELGNLEKADKCRKLAAEYGWNVISMRDDFKTIYGDNVKRVTVSR